MEHLRLELNFVLEKILRSYAQCQVMFMYGVFLTL